MFFKRNNPAQELINTTLLSLLVELEVRLAELEEVLDEVAADVEDILDSFEE